MGFYQTIHQQYGHNTVRLLKLWANNTIKLASLKNRNIFLLKCRQHQVFPEHITHSLQHINNLLQHYQGHLGQQIRNLDVKVRKKVINLEIGITHYNTKKITSLIKTTITQLNSILPLNIIRDFDFRLKNKYNREFQSIKTRNISKLNKLKIDRFNAIPIQDKWFRNISQTVVPPDTVRLLSLGPKFAIPSGPSQINIPSLLADLETSIAHIGVNKKNIYRGRFSNIICNFVHDDKNKDLIFSKHVKDTKKFLSEHPEIIVTLNDKGGVTVVMDRRQDMDLGATLLDDNTYYTKLPRDPTSTVEQRANKLVSSLKNNGKIDDNLAKSLYMYNSVAARFYALPKIHKPTLSVRPIISSIDAPISKLEKFLTEILTKAYDVNNPYFVSDSFQFSNFINNFQLPEGHILISLDVVSLFTNLPLILAEKCIVDKWQHISPHSPIDLDSFLKILHLVFDSVVFNFNNQFYKQIFGTPMGASISPIISSFVMDDILSRCTDRLQFQPPFIKRYVDDLLLAVPADRVEETLTTFNSLDEYIKFTLETESNNSIAFLDMMLVRTDNNTVVTKWYRKPTSSGRYLNYHSNHPQKMKLGLAGAMLDRVAKLSHPTLKDESLNCLKTLLIENSYPPPPT